MTRLSKKLLAAPALLAAAALGACGDRASFIDPPGDRLFFPTGMALRRVNAAGGTCRPADGAACRTHLLVASSNFDLAFSATEGGTLAVIDADAAVEAASQPGATSPLPLTTAGVLVGAPVPVGSYAGEVAVVDDSTCPGWEDGIPGQPPNTPEALVTSRQLGSLYRVALGSDGPSCRNCAVKLNTALADPFGVTVACGSFPPSAGLAPQPRRDAWVTYLRAPQSLGWLTRVDLDVHAPLAGNTDVNIGRVSTHSSAYDPSTTRLYVSPRFDTNASSAPLRSLQLGRFDLSDTSTGTFGGALQAIDLTSVLRGAEPRGLALSRGPRAPGTAPRLFMGLRVFDATLASQLGVRPSGDLAGALVAFDTVTGPDEAITPRFAAILPIDRGATVVRTVERLATATEPAKRDLVFATATDDSSLLVYDDEVGKVAQVIAFCQPTENDPTPGPCQAGRPRLGLQPFGLAVEARAADALHPAPYVRVYVGSFDRNWVNILDMDPANPQAPPSGWWRIGQERP
ncbi:MAG TPA: hypothetical protein VFP65_09125 [Anaeromyxobacteraceae bacterium]|nr:hypothetical protein [Anaeromyxobacteraceae bacterium]